MPVMIFPNLTIRDDHKFISGYGNIDIFQVMDPGTLNNDKFSGIKIFKVEEEDIDFDNLQR